MTGRIQPRRQLDFDPDEVRARYDYERDRRLREDGQAQYVPVDGTFHADEDLYAVGEYSRPRVDENVEVVILGGGFSGMMMAAELRRRGIDDIRIIEAASDLVEPGTGIATPGRGATSSSRTSTCRCATKPTTCPGRRYSGQPEIMEHVQRIAETFSLREAALFRTRITEMRWDEDLTRWQVGTDRGDDLRARFVINDERPDRPPQAARDSRNREFYRQMFRTSRWDYESTGGDGTGDLHKLADKRVAIISTGATAIQAIPHLAESAEHLYVFQRTPTAVGVRSNPLPTRSGPQTSSLDGNESAKRTSMPSLPAN